MNYELRNKLHFRFVSLLCVFIYYYFTDGKEIRTDIWVRNFDFNKIYVWGRDFPLFPFFEQLRHNSDNDGYLANTRTGNQANNDINKKGFLTYFLKLYSLINIFDGFMMCSKINT